MLLSLIVALMSGGDDVPALGISAAICLIPGLLSYLATSKNSGSLSKREGFLAVTLGWMLVSILGSLPYLISGYIPRLADAFFESISGFTTTGASVVDHIDSFPKGLLFWRALTQWLGGIGVIVLALSFLPATGMGGLKLFSTEGPGVLKEKVTPRIYQTVKKILAIYLILTLLESILLMLGGMPLFDSICHAFSTLSASSFSTKQAGLAFWPSTFIQYVVILFMILAGTNFTLLLYAATGKPRKLLQDEEFRNYLLLIAGFTALIGGGLLITTSTGFEEAFRNALFVVSSTLSTTGLVTVDYGMWAPVLILLVLAMYFPGACAGSTGGGIKIRRIVVLVKNSYLEIRRMVHPHAVIPVRFNGNIVEQKKINNILAFFVFYVFLLFVSTLILMIVVPDPGTALGSVAACLGNIGPGLGLTGPSHTYAQIPDFGKWFLSFLMVTGRLELFTVLALLTPGYWKN